MKPGGIINFRYVLSIFILLNQTFGQAGVTQSHDGGAMVSNDSAAVFLSDCKTFSEEAADACNEAKDSNFMNTMDKVDEFNKMLTMSPAGAQMGVSVANICNSASNLLQVVNTSIAAFSLQCEMKRSSCQTSCVDALDAIRGMSDNDNGLVYTVLGTPTISQAKDFVNDKIHLCKNKIKGKLESGISSMMIFAKLRENSAQCDKDRKDQKALQAQLCAANPAQCKGPVNCADAAFANDPVCKCQANPADPACSMFAGAGVARPTMTATDNGRNLSTNGNNAATNADAALAAAGLTKGGDIMDPGLTGQGGPNSGVASPDGGGAGRGVGTANLPNGGGAAGKGGGGAAGFNTDILKNARGGSGASMPVANTTDSNGNPISGSGNVGANSVDLTQFLPNGKLDPQRRGLAGVSGPDGITGPNTDIWQKVNIRYNAVRFNMLP